MPKVQARLDSNMRGLIELSESLGHDPLMGTAMTLESGPGSGCVGIDASPQPMPEIGQPAMGTPQVPNTEPGGGSDPYVGMGKF